MFYYVHSIVGTSFHSEGHEDQPKSEASDMTTSGISQGAETSSLQGEDLVGEYLSIVHIKPTKITNFYTQKIIYITFFWKAEPSPRPHKQEAICYYKLYACYVA